MVKCAKWVPWLLVAAWNPVVAFDLRDKKGRADHAKVVPWSFLVFACVMAATGKHLAWYELLSLGSLSFGYGAWRAFLASKSVSGTFTDVTTKTESTVRTVRDVAEGIDPA